MCHAKGTRAVYAEVYIEVVTQRLGSFVLPLKCRLQVQELCQLETLLAAAPRAAAACRHQNPHRFSFYSVLLFSRALASLPL